MLRAEAGSVGTVVCLEWEWPEPWRSAPVLDVIVTVGRSN